jgi:chemotaxis protein MotB
MSAPGRRKQHHQEEHENHERWLVSYADFITVLMALFIVMFALSNADKDKFNAFASGMDELPGAGTSLLEGGALLTASAPSMDPQSQAARAALEEKLAEQAASSQEVADLLEARKAIEQALVDKGMAGAVRFRLDERGLIVSVVTDDVLFELGQASLRPAGTKVLDAIAPALNALPNAISVEGHTDDLPIRGRFPSNWELSAERATSVLRYLLEAHRLPAQRVSAAGYADQRPLTPNTPAGRAANRRVEVVLLKMAEPVASPVAAAAPAAPAIAPIPPLTLPMAGGRAATAAPATEPS